MKSIRELSNLSNLPVLVRAALNVPLQDGAVANDYRLKKALPSIEYLRSRGARVILMSHIGEKGTESLSPVVEALRRFIPRITLCPAPVGKTAAEAVVKLPPGEVLVLENLRRDAREVSNDPTFAAELASLASIFVEDCFDTCHREHASIVGVPTLLPSYAGFLLEEEVAALSGALQPEHPAFAVIGGAKFATKERVIDTLLTAYDAVFIGGALANDFLRAAGHEIGASLASDVNIAALSRLLQNPKLLLPKDARVIQKESFGALNAHERLRVTSVEDVRTDEIILDAGPATSAVLADHIKGTQTILWNGPLGKYETGFIDATDALARTIADSGVHSVVGGGDTVASIEALGLLPRFSFVSTGGGAMLEYLANGTLPGIAVLESGSMDSE